MLDFTSKWLCPKILSVIKKISENDKSTLLFMAFLDKRGLRIPVK
jgi:hypothetical protein